LFLPTFLISLALQYNLFLIFLSCTIFPT
jgi:hypothetical protein